MFHFVVVAGASRRRDVFSYNSSVRWVAGWEGAGGALLLFHPASAWGLSVEVKTHVSFFTKGPVFQAEYRHRCPSFLPCSQLGVAKLSTPRGSKLSTTGWQERSKPDTAWRGGRGVPSFLPCGRGGRPKLNTFLFLQVGVPSFLPCGRGGWSKRNTLLQTGGSKLFTMRAGRVIQAEYVFADGFPSFLPRGFPISADSMSFSGVDLIQFF